jgi:uncharacterized membrane protein
MTIYFLALLIGAVAGLRTMTAAAAASWAAYLGRLGMDETWLSALGSIWAVGILTVLALVELVTDQLPSTPSRTTPVPFAARVAVGALAGAALASAGSLIGGALAGIVGALIGTLGGYASRQRLAGAFGRDLPAALIEDAVAIGAALAIVASLG